MAAATAETLRATDAVESAAAEHPMYGSTEPNSPTVFWSPEAAAVKAAAVREASTSPAMAGRAVGESPVRVAPARDPVPA
jgi:hypothetical protein